MSATSNKKVFLSIFLIFFGTLAFCQPKISFPKENHDFGVVKEGDIASYEFEFVNQGDNPLVISNVKASCGCTTPFWTKKPIAPGEKGMVKASYNSKGRPGNFNKSITVTSNAENRITRLYIKGLVDNLPEYTGAELAKSPKLVLSKKLISMGKVEAEQPTPVRITIQNTGASTLSLKNISSSCNCVGFGPAKSFDVPVGKSKEFTLVYRPKRTGKTVDDVLIYSNDLSQPTSKLSIDSEVVESLQTQSPIQQIIKKF